MAEVDVILENMSELQKYIVLLLSANNKEPIKGATKFQMELIFQKELFLLAKNIPEVDDEASFGSDFYGPYSETAKEELDELELDDLIIKENSKALTLNQLKNISQKDSSFIFNRFLEILRHNVVSDKPNAFNKIFTLFLCKIVDENRNPDEELDFQWIEGVDDDISFQKRLTDLYKRGMQELLSKEVTDISDDEFNKKYGSLDNEVRENILREITRIRLQKNNEFAIKEVFDEETFKENAKVLKEVVELLQIYKIRYAEKQQYLSDFFELLLTTGLKQESGQFFTPVPIARFICRSIPLDEITKEKLIKGNSDDLLPTTIDYAAGSGHFLTESMNEIQNIINSIDESELKPQTKKQVAKWKADPFDWAWNYMYGVEKDYRLVKTAKVGCYLQGDGIAQVIHSDGLGNFEKTKEYKDKLKNNDKEFPQDNKKFDIVISNPPYSVSAFKSNLKKEFAEKDFELYKYLTEQSSEIECLFVERTKQLLKDGGIAGIILPSSILSNSGIYTKTREIILKFFKIISIVELGSNTFMATGTNTVILFLKRRNNYEHTNIQESINKFTSTQKDITVDQIENIFSKYVNFVWKNITFKDYVSIFKKAPTENILKHEIYKEYQKIKLGKNENLFDKIIELEKEKMLYFILIYSQKLILVKSGEKNIEKEFLGYEFSNRRGSEGIHPILRGKPIDECTKLFDPINLNNPRKVSTYIYDAFENNFKREVDEDLRNHISRINFIDMMTFDRGSFEKSISLNVEEKIETSSKFDLVKLNDCLMNLESGKRPQGGVSQYSEGIPSIGGEHILLNGKVSNENLKFVPNLFYKKSKQGILKDKDVLICKDGALTGKVSFFNQAQFPFKESMINEHVFLLRGNDKIYQEYLFNFLYSDSGQKLLKSKITGQAQGGLNRTNLLDIKIPIPPKNIQEKIVKEIGELEKKENFEKNKIEELNQKIEIKVKEVFSKDCEKIYLGDDKYFEDLFAGGDRPENYSSIKDEKHPYAIYSNGLKDKGLYGYTNVYRNEKPCVTISARGTIGYPIARNEKFFPIVRLIVLIPNYKINYKFLEMVLKNSEIIKGGTNIPQLTVPMVKKIRIPLLNVNQQNKIVSEIEKIETEIEKITESIKDIPKQKENLLKKYL